MNKINDESYFDLIIDNNIIDLYQTNPDYVFPINPKVSVMLAEESQFQMYSIGIYPYAFFPSLFTLSSEICINSNIERIQSNPNFGMFGQGVIVGILDSGIDYQHPAFRYPDGSTRILSIWDQTIISDHCKAPNGFYYGAEYTSEMINTALQNDNPLNIVPTVDEIGHGTMLAGIAGGSETGDNPFSGVVPKCEFLVVKLKPAKKLNKRIFCVPEDKLCYEESDVIAALSYLTDMARLLRRPLSLCVALGTSQGGHNGKGATSGFLDYITQSPHIGVSVAAGNEGNNRRHFLGKIKEPYYTDLELNVDEKDTFFSMEIWAASPYRLSLEITSPNGEVIRDLYPRISECRRLTFIFNSTTIWINNIVSESDTGDQLILIRFQNAVKGLWRFRAYSIDEEPTLFHAWLPSADLISKDTYFLNSSSETTLTSPANANSPLSVANLNEAIASTALDSSRGYTRYNVIKPDLAAPGCNILAPFPNHRYRELTGTGASAAHAAGVLAMLLEWAVVQGNHSAISGSDMNRLLIRGAYRSKQLEYPNTSFGYGVMDIYGLFEKLI